MRRSCIHHATPRLPRRGWPWILGVGLGPLLACTADRVVIEIPTTSSTAPPSPAAEIGGPVTRDATELSRSVIAPEEQAAELANMLQAWRRTEQQYRQDYRSAAETRRTAIYQDYHKRLDVYPLRMLELIEIAPGTRTAGEYLVTLLEHKVKGDALLRVIGLLELRHAQSTVLGRVVWSLASNPQVEVAEFVAGVRDSTPHREVRELAMVAAARIAMRQVRINELLHGQDAATQERLWRRHYAKNTLDHLRSMDISLARRQAEALLECVTREYGTDARPPLHARRAASELFELRRLAVGQVAPEIEGDDLFGQSMRASSFRGKVVLLEFWGDWCSSCRANYAHARALLAKHRDQPFVIVGVNSDPDRAELQKIVKRKDLTWRSFFDGGTAGRIASQWNVNAWPTAYLLDHDGVIRFRGLRGRRLETAIEQLLAEAR